MPKFSFLSKNLVCNLDHYLYDFENFLTLKLKMSKTSGEAGGYAQIFIFDQIFFLRFLPFLRFLLFLPSFYGLKLCLKMSKTSGEVRGYAQIFIFDQELSAIWITIFMNNPWQPWK